MKLLLSPAQSLDMRPLAALVAVLVVASVVPAPAAAASGPPAAGGGPEASYGGPEPDARAGGTGAAADAESSDAPGDPDEDVVGWENGYWHNESIDVDQSDGLSDAELERFVARAMARVEYLRQAEFGGDVPVEIISRSDYRNRTRDSNTSEPHRAWNNQVWEALFIVGEDTDVQSEMGSTLGASVAGFYSPRDGRIKIITDTPDQPTIDNATLVHELVHALQDQRFNLSSSQFRSQTQDGELATDGVVEGEANYIEARYAERCGAEWDCVATPESDGGDGPPPNLGILLTLLQPYSDGPAYVHELRQAGGWDAVDRELRRPPNASSQVIHHTDEPPANVSFTDTARRGWETFPDQGVDGADTVGEASIFAMFWYQSREYGADAVDPRALFETDSEYVLYNYDAGPSDGWAGDRVVPYRKGSGEETRYGYVWVTEWDTAGDAREFEAAYRAVLDAHGAEEREGRILVVGGDDPWADAFRVVRDGRRVTVVNGPSPAAVRNIRPGLVETPTPTPTATEATTTTPTSTPLTRGTTTTPTSTTTQTGTGTGTTVTTPGFGAAALLIALAALAAAVLARRE